MTINPLNTNETTAEHTTNAQDAEQAVASLDSYNKSQDRTSNLQSVAKPWLNNIYVFSVSSLKRFLDNKDT